MNLFCRGSRVLSITLSIWRRRTVAANGGADRPARRSGGAFAPARNRKNIRASSTPEPMWILGGVIGVFLATTCSSFFFFFWEMMLVPMYLPIAVGPQSF
ncbi:hypothetical protein KCP69_11290 [Salmonella enterica subsp. enterica]|nr:hypothetical protein KCP69_11290 [Salmonella enterica subsp. enterica]